MRRAILLSGAGLIFMIIAADIHEGWQNYVASLHRSQQVVDLLSHAFSDQTARMIQEMDFALDDFAGWARQSSITANNRAALSRQLTLHIARLPYVHSSTVLDATGRRIAVTGEDAAGIGTVASFPLFRELQRDPSGTMRISRPWTSRRDGMRTFSLGRSLTDGHGQFAGVVIARVSFDYLARFFAAVNVSPGAEIRLSRTDGTVLAVYPGGHDPFPTDAGGRVIKSTSMPGQYPLRIEVAQNYRDALAGWRQQEWASAVRTGALTVLAAILLGAVVVELRRRERAEAARRETDARLQEARRAESLSLLAAYVAHDFNNVLGVIVGYGELIRESSVHDPQLQTSVDRLLGAAERARQLVKRVLTLDPKRSLSESTIVLAPILREIADQVQARSRSANALELELDDESLAITGDATEIYQVLLNLCTNAQQVMSGTGTVRVQLRSVVVTEAASLTIGELQPGDYVQISVADQGPGVAPEEARRIFDPLHTGRHPDHGTGIGLTVVRTIVERMRGAIAVAHGQQGGAIFSVYWPRTPVDITTTVTASAPDETRPGTGQVVMVVDDDPQLMSVVEDLIASLGYEPLGCTDPLRAIDLLERAPGRIDAVISDERMPAMRGVELARRLRHLRADLPVILVTGYRSAELDREARQMGISHVLDKPLHKSELERTLGELLPHTGGL